MRPHLAERLQEISLEAAGVPKTVSKAAEPLAIHTLFDLALAWPWHIERLTTSRYSRARLAAVLIAALDDRLDVRADVPRTDGHAKIPRVGRTLQPLPASNRGGQRGGEAAAARSTRVARRGSRTANDVPRVYQLQILLLGIRPRIWRRVQVPSFITLRRLHDVIQAAMGWRNTHLHQFVSRTTVYGDTHPQLDPPGDLVDEQLTTLDDVLARRGSRLRYDYDFGDDWGHDIVVEDIRAGGASVGHALCLDGARACPPEDCGGPTAYQKQVLPALADPRHPNHREQRDWVGRPFDPEHFDLVAASRRVGRVKVAAPRERSR
jgi:Plasmid pRiA4b ORF-3-like protein